MEEYKGLIFKIVRANVVNPDDQNDLYQEIAFQVWLSIPSFKKEAKVSTWIYKVALNTSLVWHRSQKKHIMLRKSMIPVLEHNEPSKNPSDSVEHNEKLEWLYKEIRALPTIDKSLVLLFLDDLSYQEMADILGITVSNVGVKLNRIKKHLMKSYERIFR